MSYSRVPNADEDCFCSDVLNPQVLQRLQPDAILLIVCRCIRLFTFGFLAVILVVYLTSIGFSVNQVGFIFSWTLIGDAVVSLLFTSHADVMGRRNILLCSSLLAVATGFIFASQSNYYVILLTAIIGVISPSGNEIGPFMAIEISSISEVIDENDRVRVLAWYNLFGSFSTAFGALFCGVFVEVLNSGYGMTLNESYHYTMCLYALLQTLIVIGFYNLSPAIEVAVPSETKSKVVNPVTLFMGLHKSKLIVLRLSFLFMIDAFAGSFVLQSLVSEWFVLTYQARVSQIGLILFCCNIVAGVSSLFAAKLAEVIGLIMTMVVTHLPSNVLLILVPLMPNQMLATLMIIARFSISQMDIPTRNAYVVGVVDPDERSGAGGVTNVARSIAASVGTVAIIYSSSTARK